MFDYSKPCGRIVEKFTTRMNFAHQMKLSDRSISLKLNSKVDWKQREILRACELLDISLAEIPAYFFTTAVKYN